MTTVAVSVHSPAATRVSQGPVLLVGIDDGPSLSAHRARVGATPPVTLEALLAAARAVDLRGRGGAAFPFATKLAAAKPRRAVVVINASEGEPASFKDTTLLTRAPHLVLDGAAVVAAALRTREVHLVVPSERPWVGVAARAALAERAGTGEKIKWQLHEAAPRFVAGQARAVLELLAGRENLPVTSWQPEAISGHKGRPTVLSNAETFAQIAALIRLGADGYARQGSGDEPGTTLLTIGGDGPSPTVLEVPYGTPLTDVLPDESLGRPLLVGGYHGAWIGQQDVPSLTVSRIAMAAIGARLGAGVVLPLAVGLCPLRRTSQIVTYLAAQTAGRCGPCRNGLPTLATEVSALLAGTGNVQRVQELVGIVTRRGACAHPDGTAALVASALQRFPAEVHAHEAGLCEFGRLATRVAP